MNIIEENEKFFESLNQLFAKLLRNFDTKKMKMFIIIKMICNS